jgi:DNA-binding response OmpR family regulator
MNNRILIVEDSPTEAQRAQWLLEGAGYQVEMAENGQVGLEKALTNPPDLVVADIIMPVMDGYEMTRRLKADPRAAAVPVLMLTIKDQPLDIVRGLEAGADHFITKSCDDADLVRRVQALCHRLEEARAGRLPEQQELERFGREIVITKTREQILQALLQAMDRIVSCQAMALLLHRPDGERPFFVISLYPLEVSTVEWLASRMADVLAHVGTEPPVTMPTQTVQVVVEPAALLPTDDGDLLSSFLHAPLIVDSHVTGLIGIFSSRPEAFDIEHVRFLFDMGQKAAEALSRVRAE